MLHVIRRAPQQFGQERSRWTVGAIQRVCSWMEALSEPGAWQVLHRLGIHYKRARGYVHSPDPDYEAKLADICICLALAQRFPDQYVVLFQDEFTYYRQPTLERAYELAGATQALARRSYRSNAEWRIVAVLNALTGQVIYCQSRRIGLKQLVSFYQQVRQTYPDVQTILMVQDNWPVHFHPDVLAALVPQRFPWPMHVPANWSKEPSLQAKRLNLPIQLIPLPTYASWANPIEKLWRKLKQERLHVHAYADKWDQLRNGVGDFLDQFSQGATELLRYVGLTQQSRLFGAILAAGAQGVWPEDIWANPRTEAYQHILAAVGIPPPVVGLNS